MFPSFPHKKYVIDNNWARGANIHCIEIFLKIFNITYENDFLNRNFKIILDPSSYFPLLSLFHYASFKMTFKFEILIFQQ